MIQVVASFVILVLILDMFVGRTITFNYQNELKNPVLWTWVSTFMLLVNLGKGLVHAVMRVGYMMVLSVFQFAILDKTVFPAGYEGLDPGYSAYLSCLYFNHMYRNPVMIAFMGKPKVNEECSHCCDSKDSREKGVEPGDSSTRSADSAASVVEPQSSTEGNVEVVTQPKDKETANNIRRRFRSRMHLAKSLSNNPSIIPLRRARDDAEDGEVWDSSAEYACRLRLQAVLKEQRRMSVSADALSEDDGASTPLTAMDLDDSVFSGGTSSHQLVANAESTSSKPAGPEGGHDVQVSTEDLICKPIPKAAEGTGLLHDEHSVTPAHLQDEDEGQDPEGIFIHWNV
eukprot:CAMPEP_0184299096 /NCGR_PEP_ID=MMETSP1049-20130417/9770_1 /TAXON_ID=77928 /ORGANISM="Proteomonas sulcata, Strain CCMP704" /LENGTH=342 /DNA_ID=CAMNT_0026609431 /DNA_START=126 /DNA_END=1154 /DNA_ORIENTATION=+